MFNSGMEQSHQREINDMYNLNTTNSLQRYKCI